MHIPHIYLFKHMIHLQSVYISIAVAVDDQNIPMQAPAHHLPLHFGSLSTGVLIYNKYVGFHGPGLKLLFVELRLNGRILIFVCKLRGVMEDYGYEAFSPYVNDSGFKCLLRLMPDASWGLLTCPPEADGFRAGDVSMDVPIYLQRDLADILNPVGLSGALLTPSQFYERSTSSLHSLLIRFLSTAVSQEGVLNSCCPLGIWIRVALRHLTSARTYQPGDHGSVETAYQTVPAFPFSPPEAPFPFEELASFQRAGNFLEFFSAYGNLRSALAKEAGELNLSNTDFDLRSLCNQLVMQILLCLGTVALDVQLSAKEGGLVGFCVLAATLARLMNDFEEWDVAKVISGAGQVMKVGNAADVVMGMTMKLVQAWVAERNTLNLGTWVKEKASQSKPLMMAISYALMCMLYLTMAGARRVFCASKGIFHKTML